MGIKSLVVALENTGVTPCISFSCKKVAECGQQKLACSSFRYFVQTGRVVSPFLEIPERITKHHHPEIKEEISATKEIFDSMEVDDDYYRPEEGDRRVDEVWEIVNSAIELRPALQSVWK